MFNMLMGSASAVQLAELADCSYRPLADAIAQILPREREHASLGETGVRQAIERRGSRASAEAALNYWYPRVADTFGRADSDNAALYVKYGLRRRGNSEMLADWKQQSATAISRLGLPHPA